MECENLSKLGLEGLLLLKNSGLVGQHRTHISAERLHVLCEEDSVVELEWAASVGCGGGGGGGWDEDCPISPWGSLGNPKRA